MKNNILKIALIALLCVTTVFCSACFDFSLSEEDNFELVGEVSANVEYVKYLGYTCELYGTLKNNSNNSYSYVSIEFSIYDADGNNLGTAMANVNNIGPGETWRFEAVLLSHPSTKPARYKLADITAY